MNKSPELIRYEKQFEFARQVWKTATGKTYTGSPREVIEIEYKKMPIKLAYSTHYKKFFMLNTKFV